MTKKIDEHEGSKYLRKIHSARRDKAPIHIDVYNVLEAFKVTCGARQHAIKKLLCAGNRGKGSELDDLIGAEAAVARAIELEKDRQIDLIIEEKLPDKPSDATATFTPVKEYRWVITAMDKPGVEEIKREEKAEKEPKLEPKLAKEKPAKEKK